MHVALVAHGLPQSSSNGGPMTCYAILRELLGRGHRATAVALRYGGDPFTAEERKDELRAMGAEVVVVPVPPRLEKGPPGTVPLRGETPLERVFPTVAMRPAMREALALVDPDALFVYHWDTLAATEGILLPRFAAVDDPWHMPNLRRWQHSRPRVSRGYLYWTLSTLRGLRPSARAMVELLDDCAACASFQAETAAWLRRRGATRCTYLPAPIVDAGGPGWEARRLPNERPTILLGPSNLGATSTSAGLRFFATEVLPALEQELGPEGFVVRVVGEGEPPPELARLLPRATVELTGRIEPADEEFLRADVQLVPTPFALGKRVRIIVGWTFGCCVVAHSAEAVNLPELQDGDNALLGGTGASIAEAIVRAVREPELRRRIGLGGRATYEAVFAPSAAARPIIKRLEAIAGTAPVAAEPAR